MRPKHVREFLRLPSTSAMTSGYRTRRKRHAQRIRHVPQERMFRVTDEKGRAVEAVNIVFDSTINDGCQWRRWGGEF